MTQTRKRERASAPRNFLVVGQGCGKIRPETGSPMTSEEPKGWEEIGESLARPVVERLRNREWAIEIAKIVGYSVRDVKAWIKHYKQIHAEELQRSKEEVTRKRAEIQELREKSDELILNQDLKA